MEPIGWVAAPSEEEFVMKEGGGLGGGSCPGLVEKPCSGRVARASEVTGEGLRGIGRKQGPPALLPVLLCDGPLTPAGSLEVCRSLGHASVRAPTAPLILISDTCSPPAPEGAQFPSRNLGLLLCGLGEVTAPL